MLLYDLGIVPVAITITSTFPRMVDLDTVVDCYDTLKRAVAFVEDIRHTEKERASLLHECHVTNMLIELIKKNLETLPNDLEMERRMRKSIDQTLAGLNRWLGKLKKKEIGMSRAPNTLKHHWEKEAIHEFLIKVGRMKGNPTLLY